LTYRRGQFVNCAFPTHERPNRPETERLHVGYIERIFDGPNGTLAVVAVYTTTTSRPSGQPKRRSIIEVNETNSRKMGMERAFSIDPLRFLIVPVTKKWFPDIDKPDQGVRGVAPQNLQDHITKIRRKAIQENDPLLDVYPRSTKP
jgi:hypothetical protein